MLLVSVAQGFSSAACCLYQGQNDQSKLDRTHCSLENLLILATGVRSSPSTLWLLQLGVKKCIRFSSKVTVPRISTRRNLQYRTGKHSVGVV